MAYKRYDTPNHPRWDTKVNEPTTGNPASNARNGNDTTEAPTGNPTSEPTTDDVTSGAQIGNPTSRTPTGNPTSRWQYGRTGSSQHNRHCERAEFAEPPLLVSREETGDDAAVELEDTPKSIRITAELPDASLDDVRVSTAGRSIRVRAESPEQSTSTNEIDRTITLAETVTIDDVVVAYHDPVLTVVVSKRNPA